jgi:D-3-phosphoglycerate dehydrogenase
LALALVLAGLRHVPRTDAGIKQGAWPRHNGREIDGARVGIVGCGAVGALLAQMCDQLGADVVGFDPREPNVGLRGGRLTYAALPELLAACDIVSLHCPMPPDGRAIVTRELLANAPSGAIIVNTARAALVDQDAVLGALDDGRLSAYATDVFDTEPPSDLRLARHPSVIATSHIGGLTIESVERATQMATDSILAALLPAQRGA